MSRRLASRRRSVAISTELVEAVNATAPPELRGNFNRLVTVALEEYAVRHRALAFERAMARMASDPTVAAESAVITREFRSAESDGLAS